MRRRDDFRLRGVVERAELSAGHRVDGGRNGETRGTKACAYDGTSSSENVYGADYYRWSRGVQVVESPRVMLPNR